MSLARRRNRYSYLVSLMTRMSAPWEWPRMDCVCIYMDFFTFIGAKGITKWTYKKLCVSVEINNNNNIKTVQMAINGKMKTKSGRSPVHPSATLIPIWFELSPTMLIAWDIEANGKESYFVPLPSPLPSSLSWPPAMAVWWPKPLAAFLS